MRGWQLIKDSPLPHPGHDQPLCLLLLFLLFSSWQGEKLKPCCPFSPPPPPPPPFFFHSFITDMGDDRSVILKEGACPSYVFWSKLHFSELSHGYQLSYPKILGYTVCVHKLRLDLRALDLIYEWMCWSGMSCSETFECSLCVDIIYFRKESLWNRRKLSGRTILSTSIANLHICILWTHSQVSMAFKGCRIRAFASLSLLSKL